ncbi:hypothetical protein BH18GEM1_BH18GEM1_00750 [soil metagenome]
MRPTDGEDDVNRDLDESRALLTWLDREAPPLSAADVIEIARRRGSPHRSMSRGMLWAASMAGLLSAALVAAAIPGSPVRTAVQELIDSWSDTSSGTTATTASSSLGAGVSMMPGKELEIIFEATQTRGSLDILLQETDKATIEVEGGNVGLEVGAHSVTVRNRDAEASYRIVLPEDLPHVQIRVGNRTIFLKQGASHQFTVEKEGGQGAYRVPFPALSDSK